MKKIIVFLFAAFLLNAHQSSAQVISRKKQAPQKILTRPSYKTGDWSTWRYLYDVQYRFRWGIDPSDPKYQKFIDVIFEIKNPKNQSWLATISTLNCDNNDKSNYKIGASLKPLETKTFTFLAPNCRTVEDPLFRYDIAELFKID